LSDADFYALLAFGFFDFLLSYAFFSRYALAMRSRYFPAFGIF